MRRPRDDTPGIEALFAELEGVYRDADALFAGWSCPASTECCRFGITGLEPYVTSIEFALVQRAVARNGGPLQAARRALPLAGNQDLQERRCPMLDASGRCSIYAARPFGCRTFFCARATEARKIPHRRVLELVRRVEQIAARHIDGGDQPHRFGKLLERG